MTMKNLQGLQALKMMVTNSKVCKGFKDQWDNHVSQINVTNSSYAQHKDSDIYFCKNQVKSSQALAHPFSY